MDESRASNLNNFSSLSGNLASGTDSIAAADGTGEPLFVINLCAAMTPIDLAGQALTDLHQYKIYQVSRMEDGRRRYRLRLGFFTTESQAEDVLSSVRGRYATAFTSCLCEEDLKHATGYLKCSVKDLERTGRYAVQKLRGDSGATTTIRAMDASALQQMQAAETPTVKVKAISLTATLNTPVTTAPMATVSPIRPHIDSHSTEPAKQALTTAPTTATIKSQPVPRTADGVTGAKAQPPAKKSAVTPPRSVDLTVTTAQVLAQMQTTPPPKRESLMRRAHAMAPMDAVERAKGVPGTAASAFVDTLATGKFKLPTASTTTAPATVAPPAARQATQAPAPSRPIAPPVNPATNAASKTVNATVNAKFEAQTPPVTPTSAPIQKRNQPFHVGAGVNIPETSLSLAPAEPLRTQAKAPAAPAATQVSPIIANSTVPAPTNDLSRVRELAKQSIQWRQDHGEVPTLDTTQTIRTLSKSELEDPNRPKWFTVQLAISDHPANLDTMPKLDIFDAYSLYSVAVMEGSGIRHALRLGFFREEVSAMAVMGYLKTFFSEPVIARIPDAEYERFIDAPKLSALTKSAANNITLDDKHAAKHSPIASSVPTVSAAVTRTASMNKQQPKPMARAAAPASKHAAVNPPASKRPSTTGIKPKGAAQQDLLDEANLLGLSDTAIQRVQKNPSLLSRLVGKIGK